MDAHAGKLDIKSKPFPLVINVVLLVIFSLNDFAMFSLLGRKGLNDRNFPGKLSKEGEGKTCRQSIDDAIIPQNSCTVLITSSHSDP